MFCPDTPICVHQKQQKCVVENSVNSSIGTGNSLTGIVPQFEDVEIRFFWNEIHSIKLMMEE